MLLTDSSAIITRDKVQVIQIDNAHAKAEISLFGGHILSFVPKHDNRQRLWVSENALFDAKKSIRGGIPVCWPWFGDHKTEDNVPAHGYVRTQTWKIISSEDTASETLICLQPASCSETGFASHASLRLEVRVGKILNIQLHTSNIGDQDFSYTCALHSYFTIGDIHSCRLQGLSGQYRDKTQNYALFTTPENYTFLAETDRIHLQQPKKVSIQDGKNVTDVMSSGHDSMVVWNPWQDKSSSMSDMANDSYLTMICVETAVTQGHEVKVGETHILEQIIV
jgi:glucose-6-phosphate 1-epimerase